MKKKTITQIVSLSVITLMLASCSSSNQFASSFGKRKYNKGYYFDHQGKQTVVASNKTEKQVNGNAFALSAGASENISPVMSVIATPIVSKNAPPVQIGNYHANKVVAIASGPGREISFSKKPATAIIQPSNETKVISNAPSPTSLESYHKGGGGGGACKDWIVALLLCFFLGALGIHRFYLGYIGLGVLELLTGGCCGVLALIDFIRIIIKSLKPKGGDYCS